MVNRRRTLAGMGTALFGSLAGCSFLGQETLIDFSESETITEGGYLAYTHTIQDPFTFEYTVEVTEGPSIDVMLMERSSFDEYRDGNFDSVTHISRMSDIRTSSTQASGDMDAGTYTLLLDNTNDVGTNPPRSGDEVVVDVSYAAHL